VTDASDGLAARITRWQAERQYTGDGEAWTRRPWTSSIVGDPPAKRGGSGGSTMYSRSMPATPTPTQPAAERPRAARTDLDAFPPYARLAQSATGWCETGESAQAIRSTERILNAHRKVVGWAHSWAARNWPGQFPTKDQAEWRRATITLHLGISRLQVDSALQPVLSRALPKYLGVKPFSSQPNFLVDQTAMPSSRKPHG
jgi:hypothetical protein